MRRGVTSVLNSGSCYILHIIRQIITDLSIRKFLNEKFQELGIGKYEKNMDDIFETLMNGGNPKLAIRYARRIIKNGEGKTPAEIAPGTKVYELVEELAKYLPEKQKKCFD